MNGTNYSSFVTAGQRITLSLQVQGREPFHEWAEIVSVDNDLLEVKLSRDVLPVGAQTAPGSTLEVRTGSKGNGYRCRGIIISKGSVTHLSLRLIGELLLDELREYFRIDVYLPFQLSVPPNRDVTQVKEEWLRRRAASVARNLAEFPFVDMGDQKEGSTPAVSLYPPPQAANISGGGVRVTTAERLQDDDLVFLEIYLPLTRPMIIDVVGQVITATEQQESGRRVYSTALRYFHIDERDRDRIVEYITGEQLAQLRSYRKDLPLSLDGDGKVYKGRRVAAIVVGLSLACLGLMWFYSWFSSYGTNHPKSEIHRLFEEGLRRHMEKFR